MLVLCPLHREGGETLSCTSGRWDKQFVNIGSVCFQSSYVIVFLWGEEAEGVSHFACELNRAPPGGACCIPLSVVMEACLAHWGATVRGEALV